MLPETLTTFQGSGVPRIVSCRDPWLVMEEPGLDLATILSTGAAIWHQALAKPENVFHLNQRQV